MTNRELLNTPKEVLSAADRQRLFLLRVRSTLMPCPACRKAVDGFAAAGITVDQFDFGRTPLNYRCPACGAGLEQVVPPFSIGPLWHWRLKDDWLQEQLAKSRAFDRVQGTGEGEGSP
jgi:hypothetical protein